MPRHTLAGSGRLDAARIRSHGPRRRRIITRHLGRWGTGWAACTHGRRGMTESSRPCDAIVGASGADAPGTQLIVPGVPGVDRRSWLALRLDCSRDVTDEGGRGGVAARGLWLLREAFALEHVIRINRTFVPLASSAGLLTLMSTPVLIITHNGPTQACTNKWRKSAVIAWVMLYHRCDTCGQAM